MLCRGFRIGDIGTDRLSWDEFRDLIEHMPPVPESALYRARFPKTWHWTAETDLLAEVVDELRVDYWHRIGSPEDRQPARVPRPSEFEIVEAAPVEDEEAVSMDEIEDVLEARRKQLRASA